MKRLLAIGLLVFGSPALAQNIQCPTRPVTDSTNACASTAFVNNFAATNLPLPNGQVYIGSAGNLATPRTISQDCTITNTGVLTCLKTNNVAFGPFATGTDAANLTGTVASARISGSYTGITGVGTLTVGVWNGTAIGPTFGGTGQTSYAVGDILYADTTTTLAKLPDVATGNALISGGINTAPSYGKIDLTTTVSNRLPFANLTQGSARSLLGVAGNATADVASIQGTANQIPIVNNAGTALAFTTVSGDLTNVTGVFTIANAAVTYAKIQNLGALAVMGRSANSSGVGADIQATAASDAVLRESGSVLGFGTIATGGIANNAVTLAKLATQATNTVLGNATAGTAVPTALAVGSCSTAASALNWTTNTGFGCNTSITAAAVPVGGITGLGTGVATALGVNVGTAGAFVVNGGALGSPSSAGTIPAFTLGGTIAGGGNQLNNIIIGTSTPLAGTFTTLVGTGGTHTGITSLGIRDTSAAFDVTIAAVSSSALTAGRTLTLDMQNVAHTLKLGSTASTIIFPNTASDTVAMLAVANSFTANQTITRANPSLTVSDTGTSFAIIDVVGGGPKTLRFGAEGSGSGGNIIVGSAAGDGVVNMIANQKLIFGTNNTLAGAWIASGALSVGRADGTGSLGEMLIAKITDPASAPGATNFKITAVAGTSAGTCKLVARAGTSATAVTIVDNVGGSC